MLLCMHVLCTCAGAEVHVPWRGQVGVGSFFLSCDTQVIRFGVSISIQWLPDISFNLMLIIFLLLCVCVDMCMWISLGKDGGCCCRKHRPSPIHLTYWGRVCQSNPELTIMSHFTRYLALEILSLLLRLELQKSSLANQHLCGFWGLGSSCLLGK